MIQIEDLLRPSPERGSYGAQPEMDPLTEDDALQEAQLLDIRFDMLRLTVGFLFELRMALQLREANTGVLVAHGVRQLTWHGPARSTKQTAWTVGGSEVRNANEPFPVTGRRCGWPLFLGLVRHADVALVQGKDAEPRYEGGPSEINFIGVLRGFECRIHRGADGARGDRGVRRRLAAPGAFSPPHAARPAGVGLLRAGGAGAAMVPGRGAGRATGGGQRGLRLDLWGAKTLSMVRAALMRLVRIR